MWRADWRPAPNRAADARVAIIGAGVSGLVTADVLHRLGFAVTVFEALDEVGGVWNASRGYPGLSTQDDRVSYAIPGWPMPASVAEHPTGEQVRTYLEDFAERTGVRRLIQLGALVRRAEPTGDERWLLEVAYGGRVLVREFDWLIAANGTFSKPHVPSWRGRSEFEAAGGSVLVPSEAGAAGRLERRRVVVVGWGKTACDLAVAAATSGAAVEIVARTLTWKYPKRIGPGALTFRHIVLTRAGERLFGVPYRSASGRLLFRRIPERLPRRLVDRALARRLDRLGGLSALGLRPTLEARASTSLLTEGFLDGVADGAISVHRDTVVQELLGGADGPRVRLRDGSELAAGLLVAATGYERDLSFLAPEVIERLRRDAGALRLHRGVLAVDLPHLAVTGWSQNYRSPLTATVLAVWIGAAMLHSTRAFGITPRTTECVTLDPASYGVRPVERPTILLRDLDRLLDDAGVRLTWRQRLRQVWRPVEPSDYADLVETFVARMIGSPARPSDRISTPG